MNVIRFSPAVIGFASVATDPAHRGKGHSALLVRAVMELHRFLHGDVRFLLFSEVPPSVYERHGFRVLMPEHQHFLPSVAMATGDALLSAEEAEPLKAYF
jgi:GNAT superfamily N-acetyltransferase